MSTTSATAAIRAKRLPIIIVPGTMGTRLSEPATGKLVWNPTADRGAFAADADRLKDLSRPLSPDEKNSFPVAHPRFLQALNIRHINNLIFNFYGPIALAMQHDLRKRLAPKNIVPVVYCCGYDFRVDNALSAQRLSRAVDEAREECDGAQAIVIAHSMGGLITRHYCKALGGEPKIRAVVLLASPTHGAPDAYFTLRTGIDTLFPLRLLLFQSQEGSRQFVRSMPSVYQLLPTMLYGRLDPTWVAFDKAQTGFSPTPPAVQDATKFADASENFFLYRDIYTGLTDDVQLRASATAHLQMALTFDSGLLSDVDSTYMHPSTIVVVGSGHPTKGRAHVRFQGVTSTTTDVQVISTVEASDSVDGDKTVPLISGNPIKVRPAPVSRRVFAGVEHQAVPADPGVIKHVIERVDALL